MTYTLGRRGAGRESFSDVYALGRWFKEMERRGAMDPEEFQTPDEDGRNGYRIVCVTDSERVAISYFHPRLVMGRIEGARAAGARAAAD
ncbi:hypothetical protein GCM10023085_78810 [Actinomadura viridis]